jgi:penicillin-binding protein
MMKTPAKNKRFIWSRLFAPFLLSGLICLLVGMGTVAGYLLSAVDPVNLDRGELIRRLDGWSQTSYATFREGSSIGAMRSEADRKWVSIEKVSPHFIHALIATEDKDFLYHPGLSARGLARAAWDNMKHHSFSSGGSTITQQLVKNVILENREKALKRKAQEMWLAVKLEQMLSKEQILTYYLNSLFFGKGADQRNLLGVQAAARGIFGVDASRLNLAQSAYLAGMIQRPNAFSPFHPDSFAAGQKRMKTVIRRMRENHLISTAEAQEALAYDLSASLSQPEQTNAYHRHPFVMAAVEERAAQALMKAEGLDAQTLSKQGRYRSTLEQYRKRILTGGYRIVTTLDPILDQAVNRAATRPDLYAKPIDYIAQTDQGPKPIRKAQEEVGVTLIDPQTGAVLAFVGGRDFTQGQTNHAFQSRRQPGSIIKPLLDYGPALEKGLAHPATVFIDEPLEAEGDKHRKVYKNQSQRYKGPVTLREALRWSLNIPAIKALREVGVSEGFQVLKAMDFPIHPADGEASAIGGFTWGFTVEEMTAGYGMLAADGVYYSPYLIDQIEDADGNIIYRHQPHPRRIFSVQTARWMTDLLQDVVKRGTGRMVHRRFPSLDLAGKTGTTQRNQDVWFMGYTPRIALGVWVGYDWNHPLPDDKRAKRVWSEVFQAARAAKPEWFPSDARFPGLPASWEQVRLCRVSGQRATADCEESGEAIAERLPPDRIPADSCSLHQSARIVYYRGKRYLAHPNTPDDFTEKISGLAIPPEEKERYSYYDGPVIPEETDPRPESVTPVPPQVSLSPGTNRITLTWSPSTDIAGVRIYRDGIHVASIPADQPPRYTGPPGFYSVTAVGIDGWESEALTPTPPLPLPPTQPEDPTNRWKWW